MIIMKDFAVGTQPALSIVKDCLVASIQADLYDDLLMRIRKDTLYRIHSERVKGVVFDMSAVRVLDSYGFNYLADTARMTMLLGVEAFFVGFRPGVVSALVGLDVDTDTIRSFRTMDEVFEYLEARSVLPEEDEPLEEEDEPEDIPPASLSKDEDGRY